MLISKSEIDGLKRRHELGAFIASCGVELKRKGAYLVGRCAFHDDRTASLIVNPKRQLWNCLGACRSNGNAGGGKGKSGGDLFAFAMKVWGVDFREAFKRLGGEVKDELPPPRVRRAPPLPSGAGPAFTAVGLSSRAPRTELFSRVVERLHGELARSHEAQAYLESRGLVTRALWSAFKLGFSSGSLEELAGEETPTRKLLIETGLLTEHGRERMAGRLVFPLTALNQLPVNLYGRAIVDPSPSAQDDSASPRHLFLPGPRRGLFNWNAARRGREILIVESVIDALSLIEAGVGNVIPIYGVNGVTEDHRELVRRFGVQNIILGLDADEAGREKTPEVVAAFEALSVSVRILEWPEKDPNEILVKHGPKKTREIAEKLLVPARGAGAPAAVRGAITSPPLIAEGAEAVKEESEISHEELLSEVLTLTSDGRLWKVVWSEGCSPSHLRATLRVRIGEKADAPAFLDSLDLVSARARESFARRAAAAGAGGKPADSTVPEAEGFAVLALQRALEADLLKIAELGEERRRAIETKGAVSISMAPEERARALAFLRDPEVLDRIASDLDLVGYVGEKSNKQIGYLVSISRKLDAALSMVILSPSGSGKSALAEALEAVTPEEDLLSISRLTPQALYYMPRDGLLRKFIVIEERAGSFEADYSIRALQSKKKLTLAVPIKDPATGQIQTKIFEILGPAAFLETTTESAINIENATRCFEVLLDESVEQTRRIQAAQRRGKTAAARSAGTSRAETIALHKNAQRLLRPLPVVIPYAEAIEFPSAWLRTRRDHLRFLHLMEVLAFLNQYQRPLLDLTTGARLKKKLEEIPSEELAGVAIEAAIADYADARTLAGELLTETFRELKKPVREFYETIRGHCEEEAGRLRASPSAVVFTRREIRQKTGLPNHRIKQLFRELEELEYVAVTRGVRGAACAYRLVELPESPEKAIAGLLTPEELQEKLSRKAS